jgi:hypothetical protein
MLLGPAGARTALATVLSLFGVLSARRAGGYPTR